jgi:hypothetical protein
VNCLKNYSQRNKTKKRLDPGIFRAVTQPSWRRSDFAFLSTGIASRLFVVKSGAE